MFGDTADTLPLQKRLDGLRGYQTHEIAAATSDIQQDDLTRDLVQIIADSTQRQRLPELPYLVRVTMYGDADVSDWLITYDEHGAAIDEADDHHRAHLHTRWEHWEDAVRSLNGDVPLLSLLYARRVTTSDEPIVAGAPRWFRAVELARTSRHGRYHRVIADLVDASEAGDEALGSYIRETSADAICEAWSVVIGVAFLESGAADEMKNTYCVVEADGDPRVRVICHTTQDTVIVADENILSQLTGVTLRYESAEAMLAPPSCRRPFQDLLVNGQVKIEGEDAHRARYGRMLYAFGQLHGL